MSMSGGLGYFCVCRAAHGMVLRLLCMMIDALRCAGVVYLLGMMNSFVHLILGSFELSLILGTLVIDKCDLYGSLEIS
jgi:hypothetical protein